MRGKRVALMLTAGLVLCSVAAGVSPKKVSPRATASVRGIDPFNPKQRVTVKKVVVKRAAAAAATSAVAAQVRPPYRPPVRSPYRPPRRGPFFP